jgi:uncharacterized repeat protein (TIGR01451 family)
VRLLACLLATAAIACGIAAAPAFAANPINVQISPASQNVVTTAQGCVTVKATDSVTGQPVVAEFQLSFRVLATGLPYTQTAPIRTDGAGNGSVCYGPPYSVGLSASATVTLYPNGINVFSPAPAGTTGTGNTVTIRWGGPPVAPLIDATLEAAVDRPTAMVGEEIRIVLRLSNPGRTPLSENTLSAALPAGVELVSATVDGGTCGTDLQCTAKSLAQGETAQEVLVLRPTAAGKLTFQFASRTRGALTPGTAMLTVSRSVSASIDVAQRTADLSVRLTAPAGAPVAGKTGKVVALVTNRGPNEAPGAAVIFAVPPGLKLIALGSPQGKCALLSRSCTFTSLGSSATARVTLSLVPARAATRYALAARVLSGSAVDSVAANNTASLVVKTVPAKKRAR